jgi:hypothetical protein
MPLLTSEAKQSVADYKYYLEVIIPLWNNTAMAYEVEFTSEFEVWWNSLDADEQESVDFSVRLLEELGIHLKRPHADTVHGSRFNNMREPRCQHEGRPYRVLYAFDPRRTAVLLIGGDKTGRPDWYDEFVPKADKIYQRHLDEIE